MTMHLRTSVDVIQCFAREQGITVLEALERLDELCHQDWINSLPGAPAGLPRQATDEQDQALWAFCRNRRLWIQQAQSMSADLEGFSL
jgi:hypothetical protein